MCASIVIQATHVLVCGVGPEKTNIASLFRQSLHAKYKLVRDKRLPLITQTSIDFSFISFIYTFAYQMT